MPAPKGNQFWKKRSSHGRNPIFSEPQQFLDAAYEYFQWVEENPLEEEKLFHYQGEIKRDIVYKLRPMTIDGLCLFLDISDESLRKYRNDKDFSGVISHIDKCIRNQKFEGAAADLFNPNIIARDLGLADSKKHEHSGERVVVLDARYEDGDE